MKSSVQSYDGSVITYMSYDNDNLMVEICVSDYSSSYGSRIFYGTFDEYHSYSEGACIHCGKPEPGYVPPEQPEE